MKYYQIVLKNYCPFCGLENGTGKYCDDCFEIIGDHIPAHLDLVEYKYHDRNFELTSFNLLKMSKVIEEIHDQAKDYEIKKLNIELAKLDMDKKSLEIQIDDLKTTASYDLIMLEIENATLQDQLKKQEKEINELRQLLDIEKEYNDDKREMIFDLNNEKERALDLLSVSVVKLVQERQKHELTLDDGK
jgi:hypothetical protein